MELEFVGAQVLSTTLPGHGTSEEARSLWVGRRGRWPDQRVGVVMLNEKKVYLIKSGQREPEIVRSAGRMGLWEGTADRPGEVEHLGLGSLSHCRTWQWPEE